MKIRIMAGEMARLLNINKQTLIYYDKIGLFHPESTDDETGYRYYSLEQTQMLEVILILKQFGMPLKEIKGFLEKANTEDRVSLLQKQLKMMDEKITRLQKNKSRINATITTLQKRMEIIPQEMGTKWQTRRHMLSKTIATPHDDYQLEIAVRHLLGAEGADLENAFDLLYGFPKELTSRIVQYDKISLPVPEDRADKYDDTEIIPAGWYAYYNHQGAYSTISNSWQKLLTHIKTSGYAITGRALEKWYLDAMAVRDTDHYLVELQVAVDKK